MKTRKPLRSTSVSALALLALGLNAQLTFADQTAETAAAGPTDYSVCKSCDIRSDEDEEVLNFVTLIAETRWTMSQAEQGTMVIEDGQGEVATWRWISHEGNLERIELMADG